MPRFIGGWEWIIILVIVVIIFGVGRLPEIGGALGRSIREFRMNVEKGKQDDASTKEKAEASESKEAEG